MPHLHGAVSSLLRLCRGSPVSNQYVYDLDVFATTRWALAYVIHFATVSTTSRSVPAPATALPLPMHSFFHATRQTRQLYEQLLRVPSGMATDMASYAPAQRLQIKAAQLRAELALEEQGLVTAGIRASPPGVEP
ncbi:hypothetical protein HaLaN_02995, partial [Haematococcus lacustris]